MVVNLKELSRAIKGGIYALAQDVPDDPKVRFSIKIGRTINFKNRLNDYHLCFNGGYRIIALLPLKNSCPDELRKPRSMLLEKEAGKLLGKPRTYANRARRGSEWYDASVKEVHAIFQKIHKSFKSGKYDLTKAPIIKFDEDYLNIFDIGVQKKFPVGMYVKDQTGTKIKLSRVATTKRIKK